MRELETRLDGLVLLEAEKHGDHRGFFMETYRRALYASFGIHDSFVQDNHSRSSRGVLRGMHFQIEPGQAKLVRCARGAILDVVVDIRRGSPTFGEWEAFELSDENARQLYVPIGFAHGFCVTSEVADVVYKVSSYYDPVFESGIAYDDPDVGIEWPDLELQVSERDASAPRLAQVADQLPFRFRRR
ncbi:MAG: dTDP-4-dehydrorhamnose 3,5-epimerase [Thermoleophilaceae bacterium]|nr:dTDP-4-dehydrorhamnose 3,5-epimerase [Thermoleophilaceae bacterium]